MEKLNTVKILKKLVSFPTVSRDANLDLINYIADIIRCEKVNPTIIKNKENTIEPKIAAILVVFLLNSIKNLIKLNTNNPNNESISIKPKIVSSEKE